jgi:hypothetical protein
VRRPCPRARLFGIKHLSGLAAILGWRSTSANEAPNIAASRSSSARPLMPNAGANNPGYQVGAKFLSIISIFNVISAKLTLPRYYTCVI